MTFQSQLSVRLLLFYTRKTYQVALGLLSFIEDKN
jgi:hypothetical protein